MRRFFRVLLRIAIIAALVLAIGVLIFKLATRLEEPTVENRFDSKVRKRSLGEDFYVFEDSWLKKNREGLWEMYLSGDAFEMGYKNGLLTDSLNALQELYFIETIREIIPSDRYLNFLKHFLAWYNRSLDRYIPAEYREEIYGVSRFASDDFKVIGDGYARALNYHAAHDIGHALQNMNLVACTAFMVNDSLSEDGSMIIGRNMDFSMGDDFASNKIVVFQRPDKGHNFAYISWAGMIGVVSGMNDQGLVVTLNAAKSNIPLSAKTPVSILARQVLQYASNIDEAYAIIEGAEVFVAESFLIGSAHDGKTVVIEKSIDQCAVYDSNSDQLILTNHYQSEELGGHKLNLEAIEDGSSPYRLQRTKQLIERQAKHNYESVAAILRDRRGMDDADIGMGNEKAVNQFIAHHSVIFKPEKGEMWVSANPYQLGSYLCYNLNDIFAEDFDFSGVVDDTTQTIAADPFLLSDDYRAFVSHKEWTARFKKLLWDESPEAIKAEDIELYERLNPEFFYSYFIIGECWSLKGDSERALTYYEKALGKEIARLSERRMIEGRIESLKEKAR